MEKGLEGTKKDKKVRHGFPESRNVLLDYNITYFYGQWSSGLTDYFKLFAASTTTVISGEYIVDFFLSINLLWIYIMIHNRYYIKYQSINTIMLQMYKINAYILRIIYFKITKNITEYNYWKY